jgi:hypothetical protein
MKQSLDAYSEEKSNKSLDSKYLMIRDKEGIIEDQFNEFHLNFDPNSIISGKKR